MTGRWGAARIVAVLRVVAGQQARDGSWLRYPTADYRCACGHHAEASGDQVTTFVRDVRAQHEATCPNRGEVAR